MCDGPATPAGNVRSSILRILDTDGRTLLRDLLDWGRRQIIPLQQVRSICMIKDPQPSMTSIFQLLLLDVT